MSDFHPEIKAAITALNKARNVSELYASMKELSFLLSEELAGRLIKYRELSAEKPSEPTPEIYDALDNLGAAGIPENGYSRSEIRDLAQRLLNLL
jgi:hypothetical protein